MSQDFNTNKPRRVPRSQRNRPVLVTPTTNEQTPIEETQSAEPIVLAEMPSTPKRRLPGFFSTVGKSEQETETQETDIAKARLARATRGKIEKTSAVKESSAEKPTKPVANKASSARPTPERPPSLFKPRYIFGMVIYLLAANFLGVIERNALLSINAERTLTKFNLFGLPITVTTSGLAFIATLIIILVVLAKLDFLPTSLSAAAGGKNTRRGTTSQSKNNTIQETEGTRNVPPPMKQGVQGADDELYRTYRTNQRRDKKR